MKKYIKDLSKLTKEEFEITQNKATEAPFTGEFLNNKEEGVYSCKVCNMPIFKSDVKFDSGSGWPSFYDVIDKGNVNLIKDTTHGMIRTEVTCGNCGAHLGHLFEDAFDKPTGLRYCINSKSLNFKNQKTKSKYLSNNIE